MTLAILWPTFLLVALVFCVWIALFVQRGGHLRRHPPRPEELATGAAAKRYFEPVEMSANNLANLFEMPVLYFTLVPLLLITRHADHAQVALAWLFVLLRVVHSLIHVARGPVGMRFLVYLLSCIALIAMWIGFAIDMAHAAAMLPAGVAG